MVSFADGAEVRTPFTDSRNQAITAVRGIQPTDGASRIGEASSLPEPSRFPWIRIQRIGGIRRGAGGVRRCSPTAGSSTSKISPCAPGNRLVTP